MSIILASSSPRRKELLTMLGLDFKVVSADIDESIDESLPPDYEVKRLSYEKAAAAVASAAAGETVIAADTVVVVDGQYLGKPGDKNEAFDMLKKLSGRKHEVYTGLALLKDGISLSASEVTKVFFEPMTDEQIWAYIETGEPMDKAGAYGVQGRCAVYISRIEGDFFNVMGLPLCALSKLLAVAEGAA